MPTHSFEPSRGRLESMTVESRALRDNLLGDPAGRVVSVYLPEGYDGSTEDYPLFVCLAGFTSSGLKKTAWQGFGESVPQRLDRLRATGEMGPAVVAFPDCFTSLGGNQYINSAAMGHWEDYLLDEVIPLLEQRFRIREGRAGRAVFGKSSGGYGALVHALKHGDRWAAVACHSGDIGWELVYLREMPKALDVLARHDGDIERFVGHIRSAIKIRGEEMYALMLLAMSATYDPDPSSPLGVRLPVDPHTCELIEWIVHRLRLARPIRAALRQPRVRAQAERARHRARLRRIRRRPLEHRLPYGHLPSVSLPRNHRRVNSRILCRPNVPEKIRGGSA
jgi:hypothetical protein